LSEAAGIEDLHVAEPEVEREMSVADENEVGRDGGQRCAPLLAVGAEIAVERIGRSGVQQDDPLPVEDQIAGARKGP
jgi:hypothetical protein